MSRNRAEPACTDWHLQGLCPCQTAAGPERCYENRAGEEALFRALLAERDMDGRGAQFWLCVYAALSQGGRNSDTAC